MQNFQQLNLHPDIFKAINVCGYSQPTPIQAESIPHILEGKDVVASAQTGTGKTAAFVLPALHRLCGQEPSRKTRILVLTPTRELASQITKAASIYGKFLRFNIVSLVGGMSYHHQIKDLNRGADIIVATPGRLLDHIENKRVDLSNIEMLILDEADRMLDMGFIDDVQYIAKLTPAKRQTLMFSATVDNKLTTIVRHLLRNPTRIDLSNKKIAAPQIKQEFYKVSNPQQKPQLLKRLLNDKNVFKAIIFSATKINADKLATKLRDEGFAASALHGDLRQNVRNRTVEQFRRDKIQILVATDVAARGIDIDDVTHVINYDLPKFCEDYVHRIGRTGRAGKTGIAISFVLPTDMRHLQRIERFTGDRLKLSQDLPSSDAEERVHSNDNAREILSLRAERPVSHQRQDREKYRDRSESRGDRFAKRDRSESRGDRFAKRDKPESRDGRFAKRDKPESRDDRFAKRDKPESRDSRFAKRDKPESRGDRFAKRDKPESRGDRFAKRDKPESRGDRFAKRDKPESRGDRFAKRDKSEGRSDRSESRGDRFAKEDKANFKPRKRKFFSADKRK